MHTTADEQRRAIYEIAEAIAPGWERWRAHIEEIIAPVRALDARRSSHRGPATRCSSSRPARAIPGSKLRCDRR